MKKLLSILAVGALVLLHLPQTSFAADCAAEAKKLAKQTKAEVLSVTSVGSGCEIKLLVPGKDGEPPRVVTETVNG